MAKLYFKIGADYDKVIRLRDEIKKLENQLKSFGMSTPDAEIKRTEERLASSRQEFTRLAAEAAKAGAEMQNGLKKKIDSVTKSSDELSAEIIKQRAIIRETKEDVRMLSEQYSKMGKFDPKATSTLNQLNRAKAALNDGAAKQQTYRCTRKHTQGCCRTLKRWHRRCSALSVLDDDVRLTHIIKDGVYQIDSIFLSFNI